VLWVQPTVRPWQQENQEPARLTRNALRPLRTEDNRHTIHGRAKSCTRARTQVIVPYRDVPGQITPFVCHMTTFLTKQGVDFTIYIVNQTDRHRFNRGYLLNVGYAVSHTSHDYMALHDIDLLPINDAIKYVGSALRSCMRMCARRRCSPCRAPSSPTGPSPHAREHACMCACALRIALA